MGTWVSSKIRNIKKYTKENETKEITWEKVIIKYLSVVDVKKFLIYNKSINSNRTIGRSAQKCSYSKKSRKIT